MTVPQRLLCVRFRLRVARLSPAPNLLPPPEGGKAIIQSALDHYGRIDILIHNAGIVRRGSLSELSYEDFETVLDVHLRGGFHVVRAAFPQMCAAGYGRIVLTGSVNGLYGNTDVVNYSVAKAGLIGL